MPARLDISHPMPGEWGRSGLDFRKEPIWQNKPSHLDPSQDKDCQNGIMPEV
jgi:hypothetical protein